LRVPAYEYEFDPARFSLKDNNDFTAGPLQLKAPM
jgi:hypothetical protein